MRVIVSHTARREISEHIAYIAERNPPAAQRQRALIVRALRQLGERPQGGRIGRVEGTRELVIQGTPFLAIFEVSRTRVDVLHVKHGRQQWPEGAGEGEEAS